jgi:hypothetical protein
MRWVHRMCLDAWRTACYKTEAYYRCEQCQTDYILEAGFGNSILQNKKLLHVLTSLCLVGWVTTIGVAFEFGSNLFYRSAGGEPFLGDEFWVVRGGSFLNLMYNNSYYVNPYLQEVLQETTSKLRSEKPHAKTDHGKHSARFFDDLYRVILNALVVTSFIEWMFINPSMFPAVIAFILAFRYTLHWSLWDKWSLGLGLAYSLFYIYQDVYFFVDTILRKLTCTRIKDLDSVVRIIDYQNLSPEHS